MAYVDIHLDMLRADFGIVRSETEAFLDDYEWRDVRPLIIEYGHGPELTALSATTSTLLDLINSSLTALADNLERRQAEAAEQIKSLTLDLSELASQLSSALSSIQALIGNSIFRAHGAQPAQPGRLQSWLDTLKNWIKQFSSQLWQLLCAIFRPKEWKLAGELGVNAGPYGLVNASIEITFDLTPQAANP